MPYISLSEGAVPENIMSNKRDVLSPGRPPNNHRSVVVVCRARILILAKIVAVTVSISRSLFLFAQFLTVLTSPSSVSCAFTPESDEAINSCYREYSDTEDCKDGPGAETLVIQRQLFPRHV